MVAEVNNTFDERRVCILPADPTIDPSFKDKATVPNGVRSDVETQREDFKHTFPKDFHVSPVDSRKGTYVLVARDVARHIPRKLGQSQWVETPLIDIKANLLSSKGHVKLITRLYSAGPSIDPYTMSCLDFGGFLALW